MVQMESGLAKPRPVPLLALRAQIAYVIFEKCCPLGKALVKALASIMPAPRVEPDQ